MLKNTLALGLALALAGPAGAAAAGPSRPADLAALSFEELAELRVTSVSKRPEALQSAAAAVYVITAEDIRRSGATTLPEVLRLAPNLHVARASATGYAISARGLNGSNTSAPNKLLVLVDGRSVYSPLFSGVFWDVQHPVLADVERIEVVSGPGGTLWGVNAVNGVVNVITRRAHDTTGTLLVGGAGPGEVHGTLRHGGALGHDGAWRAWISAGRHDHTRLRDGGRVDDAGRRLQLGARADLQAWGGMLLLEGSTEDIRVGQPEPGAVAISGVDLTLGDIDASGTHLLARWERLDADGSGPTVQVYYDRSRRRVPPTFAQRLDLLDLQFQHGLPALGRHRLTWGANARFGRERVENSPWFAFLPASVDQRWSSVFAQDDIRLAPAARLTLGARLERNDYTGTELLPNARLSWQIAPAHLLWSAWSRAVRAPSRLDQDAYIPGVPPYLLDGGRRVRSEVGTVAEVGYRGSWARASLAATLFHADYAHLRTTEIAPSRTYLEFDSLMEGRVRGAEVWGRVQATAAWTLAAGLTVQDTELRLLPGSNDAAAPLAAGNDPSHHWQVRSGWTLGSDREIDVTIRHVARLPRYAHPSYTVADLRLGWQPRPGLELSLAARNLGARHAEYRDALYATHVAAEAVAGVAWRF